jgi:hypothetical protein
LIRQFKPHRQKRKWGESFILKWTKLIGVSRFTNVPAARLDNVGWRLIRTDFAGLCE